MAESRDGPRPVERCVECAGPLSEAGHWWIEGTDGARCSEACVAVAKSRLEDARAFFTGPVRRAAAPQVVRK